MPAPSPSPRFWRGRRLGLEQLLLYRNGVHAWGDISREIAKRAMAMGYLCTGEVDDSNVDEIRVLRPLDHILWGSDSESKAEDEEQAWMCFEGGGVRRCI